MNIDQDKNNKYFEEGLMIIISSPSGAGKTTLCQKIVSEDKNILLSISYTTRKRRKLEVEGKHYKFISANRFEKMKRQKSLLEYAKVFGNYYGTPSTGILKVIKKREDVLFDIDWQGAKQIRNKFHQHVVDIFIMPPSINELRKRLIKRGQDDISVVEKRMKVAVKEMYHFNEYKYILFNDNIEKTLIKIREIINLERTIRKNLRKARGLLI